MFCIDKKFHNFSHSTYQKKRMNRRAFTQIAGSAAGLTILNPMSLFPGRRKVMDRIGMSTVNFRNRFASTKSEKHAIAAGRELTLLEVPEFFADRFHLHNVELWSKHFANQEVSYVKELKAALAKAGSTLINIQCDEDLDLGATDLTRRRESLNTAQIWLDIANFLGSGAIRFNVGKGDQNLVIESFRMLNQSAKRYGIKLLVENHFGMEMDPQVHLNIVREVGENAYTLPDFGNYSDEERYASLQAILPKAYQISAKTIAFDAQGNHSSFDFDTCMQMSVDSGFQGIYSVEQWSREVPTLADDKIADWMIEHVKPYCS